MGVDVNKLFDIYIKSNEAIELDKSNKLEAFRKIESDFKKYSYALSELEKVKNEAHIDDFKAIRNGIKDRLMNFNPLNLEENIRPIYVEIAAIIEMKEDLKNASTKMRLIRNLWSAFITRNQDIDMNSKFIQNIIDKIAFLDNLFDTIEYSEISRIEDELGDLKRNIEKSITMIEDLQKVSLEYDFVGEEPEQLKKDIDEFISTKYKILGLVELHDEHSSLERRIEDIKSRTVVKKERVKVIKLVNKNISSLYSYGIELNGVFLSLSDMDLNSVNKVDTGEYVYIDNFPKFGLFEKAKFKDTMNLSTSQFYAIDEFASSTFNLFLMFVLASMITLSFTATGSISPLLSVPIVVGFAFLFIFIFKGLIIRNNSKYKMPNMFYFFTIDYKIVKTGDSTFKYQRIIPEILMNFSQILKGAKDE